MDKHYCITGCTLNGRAVHEGCVPHIQNHCPAYAAPWFHWVGAPGAFSQQRRVVALCVARGGHVACLRAAAREACSTMLLEQVSNHVILAGGVDPLDPLDYLPLATSGLWVVAVGKVQRAVPKGSMGVTRQRCISAAWRSVVVTPQSARQRIALAPETETAVKTAQGTVYLPSARMRHGVLVLCVPFTSRPIDQVLHPVPCV